MAKKKTIDELSAEELYALAQARAQEEENAKREEVKSLISELKAKRRELVAKHKKSLAQIDAKISKAGGNVKSRGKTRGNITESILEIISSAGKISISDIREALDKRGVNSDNLNQTLAYLKRQGRVVSPSRSIYKIT